jgi:hypothetical protein
MPLVEPGRKAPAFKKGKALGPDGTVVKVDGHAADVRGAVAELRAR